MNYSVFKVQQSQGGRSGIFWEKETIPKRDRKFGYKKKEQRFPIRRYPNDRHYVDTGIATLSPDEPPPPKPPAKDFIKRNRQNVTAPKKTQDANQSVTLTQEQLNAILKSVGRVAGGKENALKISIDGRGENKEITIESPRRDDNDHYDDGRKEKGKSKSRRKPEREEEEEEGSIYALLGEKGNRKSHAKADSGLESQDSADDESYVERKRPSRRRKGSVERRGPAKKADYYDSDDYEERDSHDNKRRNRSKKRSDYDYEEDNKDHRDNRGRGKVSKYREDEDEDDGYRTKKRVSKGRRDEEYDDNNNRHKRNYSKRDEDYDDDSDNEKDYRRHSKERRNDNKTKHRQRQESDSRDRHGGKSRKEPSDRETRKASKDRENAGNTSFEESNKEIHTPRDAVGIPMDLSWRHMTKAERRRLMIARQKMNAEEEKKEEERIQNMMMKLQDLPVSEKKRVVRSDPVSREAGHHDSRLGTEESRFTDNYRRGRPTRSPSDKRSRTPDRSKSPEAYHSPEGSPKLPVPKQHLTLAEKKRIEWERDRVESVQIQKLGDYDPWGRPGAGAPLRTKSGHVAADYKIRQEQIHNTEPIPENEELKDKKREEFKPPAPPPAPPQKQELPIQTRQPLTQGQLEQSDVPHAMRSSFVFGQAYPDADRFNNRKEVERQQWLSDLEKQIEEKRLKELKNTEVKEEDTWANKLGQSHRPLNFPEQPKTTTSGMGDPYDPDGVEPNRTQSAPDDAPLEDESNTFIRGQNIAVDPITKKEWEEKRRRYQEHQNALKAQVEAKQKQKQLEREKKLIEDLEEEQKLKHQRELLQKQFDMEQQKIRQKEQQRQAQVNMLKAAMDEAQAKAMQEKYQRKMQHLEKGGHDTTKLRENLEDQMTSRIEELHTKRERDILRAQRLLGEYPHEPIPEVLTHRETLFKHDPQRIAKATPREGVVTMEPTHIPGLDLTTARTYAPQQQPVTAVTDTRRGNASHEPYVEDRVLTPSRFRQPSKPWSDPSSPRREFGTQTDADAVALVNRSFNREMSEVNIEYRIEKGKRVRVISAPKEEVKRKAAMRQPQPPPHPSPHQHHHEHIKKKETEEMLKKRQLEKQRRRGPVRAGSRPMWNYRNTDLKKAKKQSERDPFYEQKKRESEFRRMKRESRMLAMQDANKTRIPDYWTSSPGRRSRNKSPFSDFGGESPRGQTSTRRSKSHSPIRVDPESDYLLVHEDPKVFPLKSRTPARNRSKSPPSRKVQTAETQLMSPLIPALKHKIDAKLEDAIEKNDISKRPGRTNYGDVDPINGPLQNSDFVPFTRTIDVLDPVKADEPMPISREATKIANARRAYYEGLKPDRYGNHVDMYKDQNRTPATDSIERNPLMNPGIVTDHPTARQDQILMQLSTLKQSLMQRQRELETFSPTDLT